MKVMKYTAFGKRIITEEDWESAGVKSKAIEVDSGQAIEVNDAAAAWLMENEGDSWAEGTEKDLEKNKPKAAEE